MKNRPNVFLSHSKKDKEFIEQIAHDLRKCRIDAWYDDWEIPPGKSLRKKVFEEGIPNCDAFFVYLTPNSIGSDWVIKELDAAFIEQSKEINTEVITFISSNDLIEKLPSDIASIKCPTINQENYDEGFKNLIAAIYEAKINAVLKQRNLEYENRILKFELELEKKNKKILESKRDTDFTLEEIKNSLEQSITIINKKEVSSLEIFIKTWPILTNGAFQWEISQEIMEHFVSEEQILEDNLVKKLVSPYIIHNLVEMKVFEMNRKEFTGYGEKRSEKFYLTDDGKQLVKLLTKGVLSIESKI